MRQPVDRAVGLVGLMRVILGLGSPRIRFLHAPAGRGSPKDREVECRHLVNAKAGK